MNHSIGSLRTTPGLPPDTAATLHGPGWKAQRQGARFVLEYDSGEVVAADKAIDISAEEFERLRADKDQFLPIVYGHGG